jgi:uncharacterized peroxidase-related enzyme
MPKIKVIQHEEATGRLKEIYDDLLKKRGKLAEVHKIQSLRPESIVKHMELYMEIMFSKSELSRAEREMIAVITSVANSCEYCQTHHAEALNHYWKNEEKISALKQNFNNAGLTEREEKLCEYAELLTKYPEMTNKTCLITSLKDVGLSDEAILDATLVVAYFNFVNRIVLSLAVEVSEQEKAGYNY